MAAEVELDRLFDTGYSTGADRSVEYGVLMGG